MIDTFFEMINLITQSAITEMFLHFGSVLVVIYFLPYIIAFNRDVKNDCSIFVLNLFLGWTLIVWIILLAWSFSDNKVIRDNYTPSIVLIHSIIAGFIYLGW